MRWQVAHSTRFWIEWSSSTGEITPSSFALHKINFVQSGAHPSPRSMWRRCFATLNLASIPCDRRDARLQLYNDSRVRNAKYELVGTCQCVRLGISSGFVLVQERPRASLDKWR